MIGLALAVAFLAVVVQRRLSADRRRAPGIVDTWRDGPHLVVVLRRRRDGDFVWLETSHVDTRPLSDLLRRLADACTVIARQIWKAVMPGLTSLARTLQPLLRSLVGDAS